MKTTFEVKVPLNNSRRRVAAKTLLASAAVFLFSSDQSLASEKVYSFGVVPQQSATRLAQVWVPFLEALGRETGMKLVFTTAKDIPTFEACLAAKAYDFAYMNPYHYTVVHETAGYQAFAHQAEKKLTGLLVTRADSPIEDLKDLNKAEIAFPSPAAFGASVLPKAELKAQNVDFEPRYVKSHDSVYRAVALGLVPAGGGVVRTFGNIPQDLREQLRVFYKTGQYTPHAFASSPAVDPVDRGHVADAMLAMRNDGVLKPLGMSGFVSADDSSWDDIRALNLTSGQTEIATVGEQTCHSN